MQARDFIFAMLAMVATAHAADSGTPDQLQQCRARQAELGTKVEAYRGEPQIKRLMEADLQRASREEIEGDGDECLEALDHATKLLAGEM